MPRCSASEQAVEKQRAKGKLTARERIDKLRTWFFQELDTGTERTSSRWTAAAAATRWLPDTA